MAWSMRLRGSCLSSARRLVGDLAGAGRVGVVLVWGKSSRLGPVDVERRYKRIIVTLDPEAASLGFSREELYRVLLGYRVRRIASLLSLLLTVVVPILAGVASSLPFLGSGGLAKSLAPVLPMALLVLVYGVLLLYRRRRTDYRSIMVLDSMEPVCREAVDALGEFLAEVYRIALEEKGSGPSLLGGRLRVRRERINVENPFPRILEHHPALAAFLRSSV